MGGGEGQVCVGDLLRSVLIACLQSGAAGRTSVPNALADSELMIGVSQVGGGDSVALHAQAFMGLFPFHRVAWGEIFHRNLPHDGV